MPASLAVGLNPYTLPENLDLASTTPGQVLVSTPKPALPFVVADVTQLTFRSTDSLGRPIPAVATLIQPINRTPNGPVLVYAAAVNSLGLRCAPSLAMWAQDDAAMRETVLFNAALAMGWSILVPDHLGPRSAYGAALLGGQITLDAVRATQSQPNLNLHDAPIAMIGYSGGAMALAFAAAMAPVYAPELQIAGVAVGGMPANLQTMAEALWHNPHPAFGIPAAVAFGLEREYGDRLPISDNLNEAGRTFRSQINDACVNEILARGAGHSVGDFASSTDLYFAPETIRVMAENSIVHFAGHPSAPVYEWHSASDPLIPVADLDRTIAQWRAAGTSVHTEIIPVPEHLTTAALGMIPALTWLGQQVS